MRVILQESYMNLGEAGDTVDVKPGYARNFLIPQKIAVSATPRNIKFFLDKAKEMEAKKLVEREKSQSILEKLEGVTLKIEKKVGDDGKLYGAISAQDVSNALETLGVTVDRRMIVLGQQIKMLGEYSILIKLVGGKKATLPLHVLSDAPLKKSYEDEDYDEQQEEFSEEDPSNNETISEES